MFEMFPYVFSNVFNTLMNNTELIDNIVETVINSDAVNNVINKLENMAYLDIDIKEYNKAYIIEGNLPGISKKDIIIDYENNYITVQVKRNQVFSNGSNMVFAVVQQSGDLVKDFYVEDIEPHNIKAVFKNSLLRVYVPKKDMNDKDVTIIEVNDYTNE